MPVSEFEVEFLTTMAFPTLFPDRKGDLTNLATKSDATFGDKIKHLAKRKTRNGIIGLRHTLDLPIGHSTCLRDIEFLAREVYF